VLTRKTVPQKKFVVRWDALSPEVNVCIICIRQILHNKPPLVS
jgi:hypothetical protein